MKTAIKMLIMLVFLIKPGEFFVKRSWSVISAEIKKDSLKYIEFDIANNFSILLNQDSFKNIILQMLILDNVIKINKTNLQVETIDHFFYVTKKLNENAYNQSQILSTNSLHKLVIFLFI